MNCSVKPAWETGVYMAAIAICSGCGGDWTIGKGNLKEIAKKIESAYYERAQAREARGVWYQRGFKAGKAAAMVEFREERTRTAIGWGFVTGVTCGLCLVGLINARRVDEFLCRRKAGLLRLLKSRPADLCPDVRHLADMLSSRHQELHRRIRSSRRTSLARVMKSVGVEADSVVRRSVEILKALQTLNESVDRSMQGRLQMATYRDSHTESVWESSLERAQERITECQRKVKAAIDLLDSILLRLSGLEMESVDGRSIADAVTDIHREIEALEEAYGELAAVEA